MGRNGRLTILALALLALALVALALAPLGALAGPATRGGHGGADGKHVPRRTIDTRAQLVQGGDLATFYVGPLVYRGGDADQALVAFEFLVDQARAAAVAAGQGKGASAAVEPANVLDAEWRDQAGTYHRVHTVQGINEKSKEFVDRHVETVKAVQAAFPPAPGGTSLASPRTSPTWRGPQDALPFDAIRRNRAAA